MWLDRYDSKINLAEGVCVRWSMHSGLFSTLSSSQIGPFYVLTMKPEKAQKEPNGFNVSRLTSSHTEYLRYEGWERNTCWMIGVSTMTPSHKPPSYFNTLHLLGLSTSSKGRVPPRQHRRLSYAITQEWLSLFCRGSPYTLPCVPQTWSSQ